MITSKVPKFTQNISTTVICNKLSDVISFPATTKKHTLECFFTSVMQLKNGIKRALIKAVDTDVVVIALAHFLDLEIDDWKPSFLPRLIFKWHVFSRRVTPRW